LLNDTLHIDLAVTGLAGFTCGFMAWWLAAAKMNLHKTVDLRDQGEEWHMGQSSLPMLKSAEVVVTAV